jgi:hypothetical protein
MLAAQMSHSFYLNEPDNFSTFVSSPLIDTASIKRCADGLVGNAGVEHVSKQVVGFHVLLLTCSFFGGDIPRGLLLRVSLAQLTSVALRF